jgi:hypothetical protein
MADTPTLDELIAWADFAGAPASYAMFAHERFTALAAQLRELRDLRAAVAALEQTMAAHDGGVTVTDDTADWSVAVVVHDEVVARGATLADALADLAKPLEAVRKWRDAGGGA